MRLLTGLLLLLCAAVPALACSTHGYVAASTVEEMVNMIPHDGVDITVSVPGNIRLENGDWLSYEHEWATDITNGSIDQTKDWGHVFTLTINGVAHEYWGGTQAVTDALKLIQDEVNAHRKRGTIYCG